ncbi:MAG: hypothetical protein Q9225_007747 [Loekoesia sp. 1 TL-2023]
MPITPTPDAEPDPENVQWVYDYIPHYRLNPTIITNFLKTKWSDYDEFFVEASASRPRRTYLDYILSSYSEQLDQHAPRLFSTEQESKVTFRDLDFDSQGL